MRFTKVTGFQVFIVVDVAVLVIIWFFTPFSGLTLEERTVSIFGLNELAEVDAGLVQCYKICQLSGKI
jgi:hypothetical protein